MMQLNLRGIGRAGMVLLITGIQMTTLFAQENRPKEPPDVRVPKSLTATEQALFEAVREGNVERVQQLIDDGVDVNCHYADGLSPVHVAIFDDDAEMLQWLFAHGAHRDTLLSAAIPGLRLNFVRNVKEVRISHRLSYPLIQVASIWGSSNCTRHLLGTIPKSDWKMALVTTGDWPNLVETFPCKNLVLGKGSVGRWLTYEMPYPGLVLWDETHLDLIQSQLQSDRQAGSFYPVGRYVDILQWIEEQYTEIFDDGDTDHLSMKEIQKTAAALLSMTSSRFVDRKLAKQLDQGLGILISHGLSMEELAKNADPDLSLLKELGNRGVDPSSAMSSWILDTSAPSFRRPHDWFRFANMVEAVTWTLLHGGQLPDDAIMLCWANDAESITFLRSWMADVNHTDQNGRTKLMNVFFLHLRENSEIPFIRVMLEHGADPNVEDRFGWRAIDYWVCRIEQETPEIIELLLEHGADVSHTEKKFDYSTISFFIEGFSDSLWAVLSRQSMRSPFNPPADDTPDEWQRFGTAVRPKLINYMKEDSLLPLLTLLVRNGADVNFVSSNGLTPLMEAAMAGRMDVVVFLIKHGGEINQQAERPTNSNCPDIWMGKTAMDFVPEGHEEIMTYLEQIRDKRNQETKK